MSKTIPSVPESITRDAYVALFTSLGIDAMNTKELSFRPDGVYATVFERTENGALVIDEIEGCAVKNVVYIPVEDEE
ncbi:hypothetical protein M707_02745 [Arthrobacter sp. AK-YN10]|nr:hypothetical protein M707_02745 [Arthrobacter sp. AK-YN10]